MQDLNLTPATVIILLVILACVVLAVRRLVRRGLCDCNDHCEAKKHCHGADSCSVANKMIKDMEKSLK